jgi:TonB-dependent SusC/RagA subfamily outer membrane receptor
MKHIMVLFLSCCFVFTSGKITAQEKTSTLPQGSYKDIYDMLKNVPGLEVKSNNSNGRGSITVRGTSSLTQQGQPLFVIDGSVYTGEISNLNPQDIESISVLKDAATAYGSRGMFGVIIITSKQGKNAATASVTATNYEGSAYAYFIEHKTPLKVFDMNESVIIEGVIQKQKGDSLVFTKKRKDFLVAISAIKRVEMIPQQ